MLCQPMMCKILDQEGPTGIELRAANTIRNFPKPPAGSRASARGPPTPYLAYACFHVESIWAPVYSAAPNVCTRIVGRAIPTYVARKIELRRVFTGILTLKSAAQFSHDTANENTTAMNDNADAAP